MYFNSEPFPERYVQFKSLVYNVVLSYVQNNEATEEITQDVFVKRFMFKNDFQQEFTLKTSVYSTTINKSLDFLKHKKKLERLFIFSKRSEKEYEI